MFKDKSEEEKIQTWLSWMEKWMAKGKVVPPSWIKFEFRAKRGYTSMQQHACSMNLAYALLVREPVAFSDGLVLERFLLGPRVC